MLAALALIAAATFDASLATAPSPSPTAPRVHAPKKVVPGDVLLRIPFLADEHMQRADNGDTRALLRVENAIAALGEPGRDLVYVRKLPAGYGLFRINGPDGLDEDKTIARVAALKNAPGVKGAAPNRWMKPLIVPDDELLDLMWHLEPIGAPDAWDVTIGESNQRIGVVDTGTFLAHEDLVGKDADGFDFISDTFISADNDGRDADYNDPGDSADCDGNGALPSSFHGSHVAGTILANADNGRGIAGVNWNARLVTVRALGRCGGNNVDIMEGMAWLAGFQINGVPDLAASQRPRVINLSLGGEGACDDFSRDVTDLVADNGALPVIAAGNDGGPVNSPANCPSAIAVGAYGPGSENPLASYSSFGDEIDIVGPGGDQSSGFELGVLSFYSDDINPPYTFYQGTSMAAPHISGVISLMLALDPTLSRSDVVSILQSTGDPCRDCAGKIGVRADLAVGAVSNVDTNPGDSCSQFCSPGQRCLDNTCFATCDADSDCASDELCDPFDDVCVVDDGGGGGGGEGEGEGEGGGPGGGGAGSSGALCDLARGNLDCPNSEGCRQDQTEGAPEGQGVCIRGADDGDGIGSLCEDDRDCESGLCDRGVCTVTCDFDDGDCQDGFECDEDAAPGGLCRAKSCLNEDDDFCEQGSVCHYSSASVYVCAEGEGNYLRCTHDVNARPSGARAPASLALVALLGALIARKRRHA